MVVAIIPARLGSTRLQSKPLIPLLGKPLIQWTVERALGVKSIDQVIVATDSDQITAVLEPVIARGVKVVMTPPELASGSDRIAFVLNQEFSHLSDEDFRSMLVLNLQGDEPCMPSWVLDELIGTMPGWADVGTIAGVFRSPEEFQSPHHVKVLADAQGEAKYFSRNPIPSGADAWKLAQRHAGVYLYRAEVLRRFALLTRGTWELSENLEQLRLMEAGFSYYVWCGNFEHHEVNTPEDLKLAEAILKKNRTGEN